MDKPPTPILDSKDIHLEPTSSLTSNSSGYLHFNKFSKLLGIYNYY